MEDFRACKASGTTPDTFSRDAPYNHPNTAPLVRAEELAHIHLADGETWPLHQIQFDRTSDCHLVYCQGFFNEDFFLLIAILSPNTHEQSTDNSVMHKLGIAAEAFRCLANPGKSSSIIF